ncbi:MAG: M55 family metallopeptidase [Clostridia bacterium]|nr:M55 family metallopeptidase [Clostridia bacterium]
MRVFISADIEGVANTALWDHCRKGEYGYVDAAKEMSLEVAAACRAAFDAGADYVRVKDAHGSGTNIFPEMLPRGVELTRSWCGSPWSMVYGVDEKDAEGKPFDAIMYVGYHSAAGREGNRMSHTETKSTIYVKLNGVKCSEFMLYSLAAASAGVPSVMLSGDQMLCDDYRDLHPRLITCPVKRGYGGVTTCLQPEDAHDAIYAAARKALSQELGPSALCEIPKHFELEICYKEQVDATRNSFFPGFRKIDDNTILLSTDRLWDVMTAFTWVL